MAAAGKRRRARRASILVVGFAGVIFLVGVALAIVLVQVTATVASDEFNPPTTTTTSSTTTTTAPSNGLQVALGSVADPGCNGFGTGPLALNGFRFLLNSGTVAPSDVQVVCVANAGAVPISSIVFAPTVASSGESGCSAAEETVDPDGAGCGTAGELAGILQFSLTRTGSNPTGAASCFDYASEPVVAGGSIELIDSTKPPLGADGLCQYQVDLVFAGTPTSDAKLAASTDTVGYTIDLTASP